MTLTAEQGKAAKELDYLLEIEIGHRIDADTWQNEGAGAFSIAHLEGEPSRVKACVRSTHVITTYAKVGSIVACQGALSSWYYTAGRLYVHMSGGDLPSTASKYYLSSYFWECLCNGQREGSQALYNNDVWYLPYLDESSIPDVSLEVSMFSDGGIRQSFGTISLLNADGYFDSRIADYIYSGKQAVLKVGAPGDTYVQFVTIWRGWTGNLTWTDEHLAIDTEDERKIAE
jgi:hypothetical protein